MLKSEIHQCVSCKMQTSAVLNTLLFICGVLSSIIIFVLVNNWNWKVFKPTSKLVYIPEETFLQTRDDYSLYSTVQNAFRGRRPKRGTDDDDEKSDSYENTMEALSSLKMAEEMKASGKLDKAMKIYKHALALAPRNPEVLIKFGEYLEHNQRDIVLADQYYYQVLNLNPENSVAIKNRQRTAHKVEIMDQQRLNSLDEKREALSSVSRTNAALRRYVLFCNWFDFVLLYLFVSDLNLRIQKCCFYLRGIRRHNGIHLLQVFFGKLVRKRQTLNFRGTTGRSPHLFEIHVLF